MSFVSTGASAPVSNSIQSENQNWLADLFETYQKNCADSALNDLLVGVTKFSHSVMRKVTSGDMLERISGDVSQQCAIQVWTKLGTFKGVTAQFPSWCWAVCRQVIRDEIRKIRLHDSRFTSYSGGEGESDEDVISSHQTSGYCTNTLIDEDENQSGGRTAVLSKDTIEAAANYGAASVDLQRVFGKLSNQDKRIAVLDFEGFSPSEIAEKIGLGFEKAHAKKISNRLSGLRELLHPQLYFQDALLHTCKVGAQSIETPMVGDLCIEVSGSYRLLSACRCKQRVTKDEMDKLIEDGAQYVLKARDGEIQPLDGKFERLVKRDVFEYAESEEGERKHIKREKVITQKTVKMASPCEIWLPQAVRVWRTGLSSSRAHIEKAYGIGSGGNHQIQLNIEIEHEMSLQLRKKLIVSVPSDVYDRQEQESRGRSGILAKNEGTESRSGITIDGEFIADKWVAPEKKPLSLQTFLIDETALCPSCESPRLRVSEYIDDKSKKHECPCGYLAVFKK